MPVHNADIAAIFEQIADLLEIRGDNPFRILAGLKAHAGQAGRVKLADLQGDLHLHTRASDGRNSIREMALAAQTQGLSYIAITEHSRRLAVTRGLDPQRLARQIDEIDTLNAECSGITVLKGIEVDILEDGTLDLPDPVLARLDVVIAAVHGKFDLPRRRQTDRILRALLGKAQG